MRFALVAAAVFSVSAVVTAQSSEPDSSLVPRPSIGLPLPTIGLPLPHIGLPLPPMGLPRAPADSAPALDARPSGTRSSRGGTMRPTPIIIYFVPISSWPYPETPAKPTRREEPTPRTGRLRLALQRGVAAQIYIDGFYVGMVDDDSGELTLDAGPHHVELRADGYESLEVDVQVPADRPITFRGTLKPAAAAPTPAPQVARAPDVPPPSTIYAIPGCYVGNVLPGKVHLPPGCDERSAIAFEPRP